MGKGKLIIAGLLIMIGLLLSNFITGFIDGILFAFLPTEGAMGFVVSIASFLIYAMILAWVVLWLLRKFS